MNKMETIKIMKKFISKYKNVERFNIEFKVALICGLILNVDLNMKKERILKEIKKELHHIKNKIS